MGVANLHLPVRRSNVLVAERHGSAHQVGNELGLVIDQPFHVHVIEERADLVVVQDAVVERQNDTSDRREAAASVVDRLCHITHAPKPGQSTGKIARHGSPWNCIVPLAGRARNKRAP